MSSPGFPQPPTIPGPVLVGFSGGLDSTVLLHWMAAQPTIRERGLRAIHIHHGLQDAAAQWEAHCRRVTARWQVPLVCIQVRVDRTTGAGMEGAARDARRRAFADALGPDEVLALAHHQDDQAETFLLRALRGSGTDGLAAMRTLAPFGKHQIWRPLLSVPRSALLVYARQHNLDWIEDPSNADTAVAERNFLRHQVMPLLQQRWPHASATLARSAMLAAQASDVLLRNDAERLAHCETDEGTLAIAPLQQLNGRQRARVLRLWVARHDGPPLPAAGVDAIERSVLTAAHDRQAMFAWQDVRIQRWRDTLYLRHTSPRLPRDWVRTWNGQEALRLPDGGELQLIGAPGFDTPVQVRPRRGGERITLPGRMHSHAVKDLLREQGLPPWQREQIPVLSGTDEEVLAVGHLLRSGRLQTWLDARGATLQWHPGR